MSMTGEIRSREQKHAESQAKRCGYASGGAISPNKSLTPVKSQSLKAEKLGMKSGGAVGGNPAPSHLGRYARGGRSGGRSKGPSRINIVISTGGGEAERQMAMKQGMQVGAAAARPPMPPPGAPPPGAMPPHPPMPQAGMPPGGPPPGMPPGMPQRPPMARGGRAYPLTVGAGSGAGRLEKHEAYSNEVAVRAHKRRKAGGRV